jgi:hypothetical protein
MAKTNFDERLCREMFNITFFIVAIGVVIAIFSIFLVFYALIEFGVWISLIIAIILTCTTLIIAVEFT